MCFTFDTCHLEKHLRSKKMEEEISEFKNYSDEILISMVEGLDDELFPFALGELVIRRHPKTEELCLFLINWAMKFEKEERSFYATASALGSLYRYDSSKAITFFKENYKNLPLDAIGRFISYYCDVYYKEEEIDKELVKLIKSYLKKLKKEEITEIKDDYDAFMKAYKNI